MLVQTHPQILVHKILCCPDRKMLDMVSPLCIPINVIFFALRTWLMFILSEVAV